MALTGSQGLALVGDHAEGHVHAVLGPGLAHLLQHAEDLTEVQILLVGHDVQALVEVVGVLAVDCGSQVAGGVQGRAVGAQDDAGRHLVRLQVDNGRALGDGQQVLLAKLVDDHVHLVVVEGLAVVGVKLHAQLLVHAGGVLQGDLLEPLPDGDGFLVLVLDLLEPVAAQIVQGGILFGFLVELDVQAHQLGHAVTLHVFLLAPGLVGVDHLAELGAPVAQVIDAHGLVAQEIVDALEGMADHGGAQVADVEALGNVDGGVVQADGLAVAHVGGAKALALSQHSVQGLLGEVDAVEEEVHVAVDGLHAGNLGVIPGFAQGLGDHGRSHAQSLGQAEDREGVIAHFAVRGDGEQAADFIGGGKTGSLGPGGGEAFSGQGRDAGHHIHTESLLCEKLHIRDYYTTV